MIVAALLLFGIASLAGGVARTRLLIGARAGRVSPAPDGGLVARDHHLVVPAGPKLHRRSPRGGDERLGGAAGVLFGGVITQELTWRWILLSTADRDPSRRRRLPRRARSPQRQAKASTSPAR